VEVLREAVELVLILAVAHQEELVAGILLGQPADEVADIGAEAEVADVAGVDQDLECHRAAGFAVLSGMGSGAHGRHFQW
jgi:hypothetical protein